MEKKDGRGKHGKQKLFAGRKPLKDKAHRLTYSVYIESRAMEQAKDLVLFTQFKNRNRYVEAAIKAYNDYYLKQLQPLSWYAKISRTLPTPPNQGRFFVLQNQFVFSLEHQAFEVDFNPFFGLNQP